MGRILSRHPDVAYWVEPRPIWMHGNAYRSDDELGPERLRPRIANYIDRTFASFLSEHGRDRFAEKTPSNCLRMPFIHALYPDARMVNIIRDGRLVVRSMLQIQKSPPNPGLVRKRLRQTPLTDWPAYVPMFFRTVWRTKVLGKPSRYWGPRPRGWRDWLDLPRHLMVAEQWKAIVAKSVEDGHSLLAENYLELRYEELMSKPMEVIGRVLDFAELPHAEPVLEYTRGHIDPTRKSKWNRTLTDEEEAEVQACLAPLLRELGYPEHLDQPGSTPVKAESR